MFFNKENKKISFLEWYVIFSKADTSTNNIHKHGMYTFTNRRQGKAVNVFGHDWILTNVTWHENKEWRIVQQNKLTINCYILYKEFNNNFDEVLYCLFVIQLRHLLWYEYLIYAALLSKSVWRLHDYKTLQLVWLWKQYIGNGIYHPLEANNCTE